MRLAAMGESSADVATIRILVETILESQVDWIDQSRLRIPRGRPPINFIIPVLRELHYNIEGDGLIVLEDSDRTPVHVPNHAKRPVKKCRVCELRRAINAEQQHLQSKRKRKPVKVAIGLAVPCREAWLRCGVDARVGEVPWIQAMRSGRFPYTNDDLKGAVYGTHRANLKLMEQRGLEETRRIVQDISKLREKFPNGFGLLEQELRSWSP